MKLPHFCTGAQPFLLAFTFSPMVPTANMENRLPALLILMNILKTELDWAWELWERDDPHWLPQTEWSLPEKHHLSENREALQW
jgi:hypothetical protein